MKDFTAKKVGFSKRWRRGEKWQKSINQNGSWNPTECLSALKIVIKKKIEIRDKRLRVVKLTLWTLLRAIARSSYIPRQSQFIKYPNRDAGEPNTRLLYANRASKGKISSSF